MGDDSVSSELAVVDQSDEREEPPRVPALADMRELILGTNSESIGTALTEYSARRKKFRDWLKEQLIEGVHYGYPPGCEPKLDANGWVGVYSKGGMKYYPPEQWTAKPSFYKAGADFVCELMNVRDEYHADMEAWEQLGKPAQTFVFTCKLISRATAEVLGEGRGVRKVGQKGGDENNAIKMAKKCAKVDAVLNAYGLADLFTQDMENPPVDPPEAPAQAPDAPKSQPRGERVTVTNLKQLFSAWCQKHGHAETKETSAIFMTWQEAITGIPMDVGHKAEHWSPAKLAECYGRLGE